MTLLKNPLPFKKHNKIYLNLTLFEAKSKINIGTSFQIKLPIIREVKESELESVEVEKTIAAPRLNRNDFSKSNLSKSSKTKPLVLFVEDNDEMRFFTQKSLEVKFQIIEAPDSVVGIKLAKEYLPDLILSDVMMPEKDGIEMTRELKNYEMMAHIPIILLSAKSKPEAKSKGMSSGADLYLTKPFETEELIWQIENLLTGEK